MGQSFVFGLGFDWLRVFLVVLDKFFNVFGFVFEEMIQCFVISGNVDFFVVD